MALTELRGGRGLASAGGLRESRAGGLVAESPIACSHPRGSGRGQLGGWGSMLAWGLSGVQRCQPG
eukprot:9862790-Alexandrium_andersonii.AAC.1